MLTIASLQAALKDHPDCNLTLALPGGASVPSHFHITEVGRTEKLFIDCGGTTRTQSFASLQVWVADDTDHRLTAAKLAAIIDKAFPLLGSGDPEVQVECQEGTISLFALESVRRDAESLVLRLASKHTACLALSVCLPDQVEDDACCGGSGCCG